MQSPEATISSKRPAPLVKELNASKWLDVLPETSLDSPKYLSRRERLLSDVEANINTRVSFHDNEQMKKTQVGGGRTKSKESIADEEGSGIYENLIITGENDSRTESPLLQLGETLIDSTWYDGHNKSIYTNKGNKQIVKPKMGKVKVKEFIRMASPKRKKPADRQSSK